MLAFKNARRQGYLELVLNLQQLGALILVYPFLTPTDFYGTFLTKREVEFMIRYLVNSIKDYHDKICKFDAKGHERSDIIASELKKQLDRIYGIIEDEDESKSYHLSNKIPPLKVWDEQCKSFFSTGAVIKFDKSFSTLLTHDYALMDYFRVMKLSYSLIMRDETIHQIFTMDDSADEFDRFFTLYYQIILFIQNV